MNHGMLNLTGEKYLRAPKMYTLNTDNQQLCQNCTGKMGGKNTCVWLRVCVRGLIVTNLNSHFL